MRGLESRHKGSKRGGTVRCQRRRNVKGVSRNFNVTEFVLSGRRGRFVETPERQRHVP